MSKATVKLQVMLQNLRPTRCGSAHPDIWEVPLQPKGGGNVLAMVYGNWTSGEQSRKDCLELASLLAAAPDLLAACKRAMAWVIEHGDPFDGDDQELVQALRAASTKADAPEIARLLEFGQ